MRVAAVSEPLTLSAVGSQIARCLRPDLELAKQTVLKALERRGSQDFLKSGSQISQNCIKIMTKRYRVNIQLVQNLPLTSKHKFQAKAELLF